MDGASLVARGPTGYAILSPEHVSNHTVAIPASAPLAMMNGQSIIILTSLSVFAASVTSIVILVGAWRTSRYEWPTMEYGWRRHLPTWNVSPTDVFALALLISAAIQGVIFIVIQSSFGPGSMMSGCRALAQVVWPSVWIVFATSLVFGVEAVLRYVRRPYFQSRGRWSTVQCIAAVVFLLATLWIPTKVSPSPEQCHSSLIWLTAHYALTGVMVMAGFLVLFGVIIVIVFMQLRHGKPESEEYLAAKRLICFLIVTSTLSCLLIPYFVEAISPRPALISSSLSNATLSSTGLIMSVTYLVLRGRSLFATRRPKLPSPFRRRQSRHDSGYQIHITSPVGLPTSEMPGPTFYDLPAIFKPGIPAVPIPEVSWPCRNDSLARRDNLAQRRQDLQRQRDTTRERDAKAEHDASPKQDVSPKEDPSAKQEVPCIKEMPRQEESICLPPLSFPSDINRSSSLYSIFPASPPLPSAEKVPYQLPSPSLLLPPAPLFLKGHRPSNSNATSATVQIGMRFSHAPSSNPSTLSQSRTGSALQTQLQSQPPTRCPSPLMPIVSVLTPAPAPTPTYIPATTVTTTNSPSNTTATTTTTPTRTPTTKIPPRNTMKALPPSPKPFPLISHPFFPAIPSPQTPRSNDCLGSRPPTIKGGFLATSSPTVKGGFLTTPSPTGKGGFPLSSPPPIIKGSPPPLVKGGYIGSAVAYGGLIAGNVGGSVGAAAARSGAAGGADAGPDPGRSVGVGAAAFGSWI